MGTNNKNSLDTSDIVWMSSFPSGVTRNTATVNLPLANNGNAFLGWFNQCTSAETVANAANRYANVGEAWAFSLPAYSLGTVNLPPNPKGPNCMTAKAGTQDSGGIYGLKSRHPGGANALLADGSVRFLKDSISNNVIWALGSRAQGEILSADAY
jgi:prepilin-type processing-associated H-X9-DG protein